jgi:hypothetical protein
MAPEITFYRLRRAPTSAWFGVRQAERPGIAVPDGLAKTFSDTMSGARDAGGEHVAVAEQRDVARSQPTAHHAAHNGCSRQVGVEMLDEQVRRECVRVRQQHMQIVRGPVVPVTGEQAARAGADEVQLVVCPVID